MDRQQVHSLEPAVLSGVRLRPVEVERRELSGVRRGAAGAEERFMKHKTWFRLVLKAIGVLLIGLRDCFTT